jgi:hypothetical protein
VNSLFVLPGAIHEHYQEQGQILRRANGLIPLLALALEQVGKPVKPRLPDNCAIPLEIGNGATLLNPRERPEDESPERRATEFWG